jgi:hypothetical protein
MSRAGFAKAAIGIATGAAARANAEVRAIKVFRMWTSCLCAMEDGFDIRLRWWVKIPSPCGSAVLGRSLEFKIGISLAEFEAAVDILGLFNDEAQASHHISADPAKNAEKLLH